MQFGEEKQKKWLKMMVVSSSFKYSEKLLRDLKTIHSKC